MRDFVGKRRRLPVLAGPVRGRNGLSLAAPGESARCGGALPACDTGVRAVNLQKSRIFFLRFIVNGIRVLKRSYAPAEKYRKVLYGKFFDKNQKHARILATAAK